MGVVSQHRSQFGSPDRHLKPKPVIRPSASLPSLAPPRPPSQRTLMREHSRMAVQDPKDREEFRKNLTAAMRNQTMRLSRKAHLKREHWEDGHLMFYKAKPE